jgi:hypothetical protein
VLPHHILSSKRRTPPASATPSEERQCSHALDTYCTGPVASPLHCGSPSRRGACLKTDDIREARLAGKSDAAILDEMRPRITRGNVDAALKDGHTATDILNYFRSDVPRISRPHVRSPGALEYLIVLGPASLVWLIGRAARYVLAGR